MVSPEVVRGLPENVHWRGARPQEGVGGVMREADLFVLPSVEDAFGLVTLEAMASALPVIVTHHVGASELISDREHGMLCSRGTRRRSQRRSSSSLRAICEPPLGRAARALVEERCSWDMYGDNVLTLIRERLGAGDENASGSRSGHSGPT